jgi:hypothetical protein
MHARVERNDWNGSENVIGFSARVEARDGGVYTGPWRATVDAAREDMHALVKGQLAKLADACVECMLARPDNELPNEAAVHAQFAGLVNDYEEACNEAGYRKRHRMALFKERVDVAMRARAALFNEAHGGT